MLMCFLQYHPATITLSALLGFIIAGATELIQLFTPGRSGNWTDVGIDYFGYAAGIFLIYIVVFIIKFIKFIRTTKKNKKDFNPYDLHGNMFNRHIK
jgi:VanZ family protein